MPRPGRRADDPAEASSASSETAAAGPRPARREAAQAGAEPGQGASDEAPPHGEAGPPEAPGRVEATPGALRLVIPRGFLAGLVAAALVVVSFLVWRVAHVFLVVFAAVLVAVVLDGLARPVMRRLRMPRLLAVTTVVATLGAALALFGWAGGPELADQVAQLSERVPQAASQLREQVADTRWGRVVLRQAPAPTDLVRSGAELVGRVPTLFSNVTGVVTNVVFLLLIGFYAALDPRLYTAGMLHLVPRGARPRAGEVLEKLGHALRWWLIGRLAAMIVVGVLTWLGLEIIGLPLAPALGAIAGLFSFVPFVGPIASAIPALLVALVSGVTEALWVLAVYTGVQFLEGNLFTPVIQQRVVSLPPAVLLSSQLALGILFGLVGVVLATPLTVVAIVLVQMLYVQQALGDPVEVLGDRMGGAAAASSGRGS